jgi:DNA-binding response OmpR family regulator/cellulose synthase/poly-beta-1,6-N-acetylglucosamine synthase-like glycosyltransferase
MSQPASRDLALPRSILLVEDDLDIQALVGAMLRHNGYEVSQALNGQEALERINDFQPDLIISDIMMPEMDGLAFLQELRSRPATCHLPVIMLTARRNDADIINGLELGADDYLPKPFQLAELLARVRAKIERPPVPSQALPRDGQTGLLSESLFLEETGRELERAGRSGGAGCLAYLGFAELAILTGQYGTVVEAELARQIGRRLLEVAQPLDLVGRDSQGLFMLLFPETPARLARQRLKELSSALAAHAFEITTSSGPINVRLTPLIGFDMFENATSLGQLTAQVTAAQAQAAANLDLQPYRYQSSLPTQPLPPAEENGLNHWLGAPGQAGLVVLIAGLIPFLLYAGLDGIGIELGNYCYLAVAAVLAAQALLVWLEGWLARPSKRAVELEEAATEYPAASAIITAHLPDCAATILETVEHFLRQDYPGSFQVILAYHTAHKLPVEQTLQEMARNNSRLKLLRVENSFSKAQNVNAALATFSIGVFVGIFEAHDLPNPDSFRRAWRWLDAGYAVVQGHCLVRNGAVSPVASLAAVEAEASYRVALPGRARMGQVSIFGGTNNFWKTEVLRQTRMRASSQTSVVELVLRVAQAGYSVGYDPEIVSRSLASTTWSGLCQNQLRRSQGWFQAALLHTAATLRSPALSARQKLSLGYALAGREISRWLALQVYPLAAFCFTKGDYLAGLGLFLLSRVAVAPGQSWFAYRYAHPLVRQHQKWFWLYLLTASTFYIDLKRFFGCMGQLRELLLEPFAIPAKPLVLVTGTDDAPPAAANRGPVASVLVVDDDIDIQFLLRLALTKHGYEVTLASDGQEALAHLANSRPNLIISDIEMPKMNGLDFLKMLRADPAFRSIPLIFLTARSRTGDVITGLDLGADDYLTKPLKVAELLARVRSKIERPTIPGETLTYDPQSGLLNTQLFEKEVAREIERAGRSGQRGSLAYLYFDELPGLREKFGTRVEALVARQINNLIMAASQPLDRLARDSQGRFMLVLPNAEALAAKEYLSLLATRLINHTYNLGASRVRLTPIIGYSEFGRASLETAEMQRQAQLALSFAANQLDLQPLIYQPYMQPASTETNPPGWGSNLLKSWKKLESRLLLPLQVGLSYLISFLIPLLLYMGLSSVGLDVAPAMYNFVVVALLLTASLIWLEGLMALRAPKEPPSVINQEYPPASAIIAAYLPNEAATIIETVEAFLRLDYPGPLQIILAYNTPRPLPVEATLQEIALRDPRFMPLAVEGSTSKAQNVNAALAQATGEFVGVFDADHHPDPDSFRRAWGWLSNGYDVVQGHCLVRNGEDSWVACMVAVEFEAIYAISHPGRARLHQFGIFGGSNGYWKTNLLRQTRMHGFMLTEDIDSSMRVTAAGYKIASDPYLVSRELAPVTLKALWNQRMRWAQGWFQVSLKHIGLSLLSSNLTWRQKLGMLHLLAWREIYPWLSGQVLPIIVYWIWKYGGADKIDWLVPVLVLTTLFTFSVGPGQTLLAYRQADPQIRRHKGWFVSYLFLAMFFYTSYKNLIARVAQIKEAMLERQWKVTPRAPGPVTSSTKEA